MTKPRDIGLVGLAVMGQSLALNMARNGFGVAAYNLEEDTTRQFMAACGQAAGIEARDSLQALAAALPRPRKILLMVRAGAPVDCVLEQLAAILEPGDLVLDGGNSHYQDTERREEFLAGRGLRFMGVGVSGGEEGALKGPSIMAGGPRECFEMVAPILSAIAAKAGGEPCLGYMGRGGAGHFVKMVHNGVEYADMQLIAEAYDVLSQAGGLAPPELSRVFAQWNRGAAGLLPGGDHRGHLRQDRRGHRASPGGGDPGRGRPEGHGPLGHGERRGPGRAHAHPERRRGGPDRVLAQGPAPHGLPHPARARGSPAGPDAGPGPGRRGRPVRGQDLLLRPRLRPASRGRRPARLRPDPRPRPPGSGGRAASSGPPSWTTSAPPTRPTRSSPTCSWPRCSPRPWPGASRPCAAWPPWPPPRASPPRP